MTEEERIALAVSVLNDTLGMDDLSESLINRLSIAVILLDPYESDDVNMAIAEAYAAVQQNVYPMSISANQ